MLYLYDCDSPKAEKIMVRVLCGLVTEQQYLINGLPVDKETYTWKIENCRIEKCYGPKGSTIIVPPTLGSQYSVRCIGSHAFNEVCPNLVVLLGTDRVTLERDAFADVNIVKAHSWLKRSEIPSNVKVLGRVLEDVRS